MSSSKKRYHLKTRLLLVISLLIFGSVVLVSTVGFVRYSDDLLRQTATQTQQLIEQIALNTGNYINDLSRLCMSPYYSERIMSLLASTPANPTETLDKRRTIENYLREVMTIPRKDILRVYILTDEIYYSTRTAHPIGLLTDYQKESWYQSALDTASTVFLPAHVEINNGYSLTVFSMVQRLRSLSDSSRTLGVIRVDANYSGIRDVLDDVQLLEKSGLFIIDNANSNSRAILDFLTQSKLSDLQAENQGLKLAASQAAQNSYLVSQLRPSPIPAYTVQNPYCCNQFAGCGC